MVNLLTRSIRISLLVWWIQGRKYQNWGGDVISRKRTKRRSLLRLPSVKFQPIFLLKYRCRGGNDKGEQHLILFYIEKSQKCTEGTSSYSQIVEKHFGKFSSPTQNFSEFLSSEQPPEQRVLGEFFPRPLVCSLVKCKVLSIGKDFGNQVGTREKLRAYFSPGN